MILLFACTDPSDSAKPDTDAPADEPECDEAEARLGYRACVPRIPDEDTFNGVTIAASTADELRAGKFLVPAVDPAPLPPVWLDANHFPLHYDFLVNAFPDDFAGLSTEQYQELVLPADRQLYAGTFSLYLSDDGAFYGFTVWDDPADDASTVTAEQVTEVWQTLQDRFAIGDLAFVPNSDNQVEAVADWEVAFEVRQLDEVDYEAYNPGDAYGYLRLYTLEEFVAADEAAEYGWQDIVVIEEAPEDLTRVVSGIVTGTRQGALSHLAVRSGSRGTPNCYIKEPLEALAEWQDLLVHLDCGEDEWDVDEASVTDAEAWWDSIRPEPVAICTPDTSAPDFVELLDLPTSTAEDRATNVCRYGAKGSNLATLYKLVEAQYQLDGFVIPFNGYVEFMDYASWTVDLGGGEAEHSFRETLDAWLADESFTTDGAVRRERLDAFQEAFYEVEIDPDYLAALAAQIEATFGTDLTMVRFRSSSNAEDGLGFSGAGLYESSSACLADEYDGDDEGPSLCDPDESEERTMTAALQEVWGSTWKMAAYEERDWYGIDQSVVAMGVLCNTRTKDELSNVVAFSGNPSSDDDDRYLLNAQVGDLDVVSAEPGVYPEKLLLTVEDHEVTDIERVSDSSEADEVLSDEQASWVAEVLSGIVDVYPMDEEVPEDQDLLWDTEWKFGADGQLYVKQIRPYLR